MENPFYKLPPDLAADIDTYEGEVRRFLSGELTAANLRAKRVPRGIYEQRQSGRYLVRVRATAGTLTASQAQILTQLSRDFGDGVLHLTTRQAVQIHDVSIQDTPEILRRLLDSGLTAKGGGGNTVRNVTTCPYAGVCPHECFDTTKFAYAVTEYLIRLVGSYNLPRKYKISFSGCRADCGLAQVSDLGFIAELKDELPGFRVVAGGGMGASSRVADLLLDWVPAREAIRIAESVRRLFDRYGDRRNRQRARLRFAVEKMGEEKFRQLFNEEMEQVIKSGLPQCQEPSGINPEQPTQESGFTLLQETRGIRFLAQRQEGFATIPLRPALGLIASEDLSILARLASEFSTESGLRITRGQELQMRFIRMQDIPDLIAELHRLKTDLIGSGGLDRQFTSCAGAATCRLGLCFSRNAVLACQDALGETGLTEKGLNGFAVHVNGCPNACGHEPIAPIGLSGAARRVNGHVLPAYRVTLGGRCNLQGARLGSPIGQVPAKSLPDLICDFARDFVANETDGETFSAYFERTGQEHFVEILNRHSAVPLFEDRPLFYRDYGSEELFSLAGRGAGECGAGVFELIQEDLTAASKAVDPFEILLATCRALLITRGIDSGNADTVFRSFEEHFVNTGLVGEHFRPLLLRARSFLQGWKEALQNSTGEANRLLDRIKLLFSTLDSNLEFHPPEKETSSPQPAKSSKPKAEPIPGNHKLDLRGVACPTNFVRAKLKLETMEAGEALEIILDDGPPIQNVPASFRAEGQEVARMAETEDGHWEITVRKARPAAIA